MLEIILSTGNPSKARSIKAVFEGLAVRVLTLEEAGVEGEAVEDGATLEENAQKKARYAWERTHQWSMADDTGLYIDALDGRPGIHAARWAGDDKTTEEIMAYTLEQLKDVPEGKRGATFKTIAYLIAPDGIETHFFGEARGSLLIAPRVAPSAKMPYSSIFVPEGDTRSWAEMPLEELNQKSQRGKAFAQVRTFFEEVLRTTN